MQFPQSSNTSNSHKMACSHHFISFSVFGVSISINCLFVRAQTQFILLTLTSYDVAIGDVKGKRVILLDDMVDTAGSLCGAAKALVEIGGATEVYACASHGVLSGPAIQRIEDSVIKEVLFLDTIPAKEGVKCDKIKYLSAAPMLADAISFIYHEDSVSRLFV